MDIFLQVKSYLLLDRINVDNAVFRLHYKVTFLILVCCSIILTARQYLDAAIACLPGKKIPQDAMNAYWEVSNQLWKLTPDLSSTSHFIHYVITEQLLMW